jgi:tyrosine-protein kinase Etk/Wzc
MTKPASLLDFVTRSRWFQHNLARRVSFVILVAITALLSLFPQVYQANVKLAPQETNTAGLSAILSQLGGNYAAFLGGGTQPIEIDLAIARSYAVKSSVLRRLGRISDPASSDLHDEVVKLDDRVEIRAMRGNLMEITVRDRDGAQALRTARAYAEAMQGRLAMLSLETTTFKRKILSQRFNEARARLERAEMAINAFRQANHLETPETQLDLAVGQLASLQAQVEAKQVQLSAALKFNTPQSYAVQAIRAELGALQAQVGSAEAKVRSGGGLTAAGIAPKAVAYQRLDRELKFSQALFDSYSRYLEGTAIEDLTAYYNMRLIEPPYLEPERQYNGLALALLALLLGLALASEFIVMRPAPGSYARATNG